MTDRPAESAVDKAREEYAALRAALAPRNHVTHHTDCGCFTIAADAIIAALEAERDGAVRERDIWRDMYRHSVRAVCGSEMAYEAQMKYDREASRARLYTKRRREETWADSPPIETEDGYV